MHARETSHAATHQGRECGDVKKRQSPMQAQSFQVPVTNACLDAIWSKTVLYLTCIHRMDNCICSLHTSLLRGVAWSILQELCQFTMPESSPWPEYLCLKSGDLSLRLQCRTSKKSCGKCISCSAILWRLDLKCAWLALGQKTYKNSGKVLRF